MTFSELRAELRLRGIDLSEGRIHWAIRTGKVHRPRLDGSMRFDFSRSNLDEIVMHFFAPSLEVSGANASAEAVAMSGERK
ncbi:MAG: hypothetical protein IT428_15195 [Planctomycetaceae bacterium]|nr:hypothetical protein [Planctomycetaceae bacterium]